MTTFAHVLLAFVVLHSGSSLAWAEDASLEGLTWTEQKCVLYQRAWDWAYNSIGPDGISADFIAQNDKFIATGCVERTVVCPRSKQEGDMANMLTMMTMNEGMASTFVPFTCRSESE